MRYLLDMVVRLSRTPWGEEPRSWEQMKHDREVPCEQAEVARIEKATARSNREKFLWGFSVSERCGMIK